MKKSLIALAVLAASGAAMAQSSVTLFGVVDTAFGYVDNANAAGDSVYGLSTSGNATSRLGFRGVEDLGGGLKAGFWLEGEIFGDNGNAAGFNFQRRSTVSLAGGFGEVRLGRDYTPGYTKFISYDVFGQVGIGQFMGWSNWNGNNQTTANNNNDANGIRSSNLISYFTPNFSGFTAGLGYGFDEKADKTNSKKGRYVGGYVAYDNGPLSVALSYDESSALTLGSGATAVNGADRNRLTLGGSYNLNVVKLNAILQQTKDDVPGGSERKVNAYMLGASAPVGAGEVKAQYALYDQKFIDSKAHQISLGYVHNLSKRTALYGTVAYLKNKDASNLGLNAKNLSTGGPGAGENQTGVQLGIRHSF
ncbi:porin [[Acidovorax] ebreus]|uniref:Porin Gram-negative type n=1 Tax=Acidovorax ebreus (strain TPSY) TaxID=535289 RepID=A0A9J9U9V0_ACIET|nr:porin [[Acidovorax] ebreus]ACM32141.1 porin Gram-negative type [[Acidovorax] ebreus TPSY]